jgi:hypothetical protein
MTARRGALAAVAATLALAPATAQAATVTIEPASGAPQAVALESLQPDVRGREYALRGAGTSITVTGSSLAALLTAANVDTVGFGYAEIVRPGGGAVLLSRDQVVGRSPFPDGPAVVWRDGAGLHFLRPSTGAGDENAGDRLTAPDGALTVRLHRGQLLDVEVSASRRRIDPGESVTFEAKVPRSGAGERLTYSWAFGDGERATGSKVTHRFARRGSYNAVVGVTTASDDVGASGFVRVQVGKPGAGPARAGGGTDSGAAAPDSGSAEGATSGLAGGTDPTPAAGGGQGKAASPRAASDGERVSGQVLSGGGPTTAATRRAARTGALSADAGAALSPAGWAAVAIAALFLLGAGRESRPTRARR